MDILFKVEIIFKPNNPAQEFINLATQLENKYGKQPLTSYEDLTILQKTWKDPKKTLYLQHLLKENQVCLKLKQR